MATSARCPSCKHELPVNAPLGLCPMCLLIQGMDNEPLSLSHPGEPVLTARWSEEVSHRSVLEVLKSAIGEVPSVLLRDTDTGMESPVVRPSSPEMPRDRGRYQLLGEIGHGGMGAVFKGRDPDLGRDLAVKILLEEHQESPDLVRRFIEEAQISGQLQHPGIVPVYELGSFSDHRPYFTMKLIKGRTLATLMNDRALPGAGSAAAPGHLRAGWTDDGLRARPGGDPPRPEAVEHHGRIVRRGPGDGLGPGQGLAQGGIEERCRCAPGQRDDRRHGAAQGRRANSRSSARRWALRPTWPPSRPGARLKTIDRRADVFALGSILCEILTGEPAFSGGSPNEILRAARRGETAAALARLERCGADLELLAVARDCLAVEARDRPADAGVVAGRMTAYLAGVQERLRAAELLRVEAQARAEEEAKRRLLAERLAEEERGRAEEATRRAALERQRRKLQLGLAASLLALTTAGGLGTTYHLQQRQARAAAVEQVLGQASTLRDQAKKHAGDPARWQVALTAIDQAGRALSGDELAQARVAALRAEVLDGAGAADRDRELMDRLVDIRSAEADDQGGWSTDKDYAEAFRRAGLDIDRLSTDEAARRIRDRPPEVATALAIARGRLGRHPSRTEEGRCRRGGIVGSGRRGGPGHLAPRPAPGPGPARPGRPPGGAARHGQGSAVRQAGTHQPRPPGPGTQGRG